MEIRRFKYERECFSERNTSKSRNSTADDVIYASNSELDSVTLYRLSDAGDVLLTVEGVPDFEEDTLHKEREERFKEGIINAGKNDGDVNKVVQELLGGNKERVIEEWRTNGTLTCTDDTVFMEYRHKLLRWRHGETAWHDTGLEDIEGISPIEGKGFTLAVSGNTVYAGKREETSSCPLTMEILGAMSPRISTFRLNTSKRYSSQAQPSMSQLI